MKFVTTKTADQLDLQALHRVRERLVSQRTGVTNQIRALPCARRVSAPAGRGEGTAARHKQRNCPFIRRLPMT
jgi:transposase